MGPTATGKTELAVEWAQRLPCEIISVDSAMIYRGMSVGTAKPSPDTLRTAPHHLVDILDPSETYSAARFREDALTLMADITARGRVPLLVGGTMLYFRALDFGLDTLPDADPVVRARIDALAADAGWEGVHLALARVDPVSAARIHPNDPQRLQRALEVFELTGRPLSSFHAQPRASQLPYDVLRLALMPADRTQLRERIARRFHAMLEAGFMDEVRALKARGDLNPQMPSIRAVGYRQAWACLEGELDDEAMVSKAITATRQLAKRQMTWLRSYPQTRQYDPETLDHEGIFQTVAAHVNDPR
ncbi:tRNA dimethylallyltransferase [Ectothiorhodospira haloalkaliphila]|uniref:tRNA dimethylallyltransferase n=1 Tax=Ectothiorhodospira haloalkaliphila TaxID=421628 RepID=W8KS79_9GAMM|nr:tRNA dimethylallyltransferase [Ectothiorhodospira haloalkaliphila]